MNVMNKLTLTHMLSNKKRTVITMIGIIVSVAMVIAVATGALSFLDFMQRFEMNNDGYWHVSYTNVNREQAFEIKGDSNTKNMFLTKEIGYAEFLNSGNEYKPYFYLEAFDKNAFKDMALKLEQGRFPESSNEIVMPRHALEYSGKDFKVGDELELSFGKRVLDMEGETSYLNQDTCLIKPEFENGPETFVKTGLVKKYKIVGIIERPAFENYVSPGFSIFTYLDENEKDNLSAFTFLDKVNSNIYEKSNELADHIGLSVNNIDYNSGVLRFYGVTTDRSFNFLLQVLSVILVLIIMIGSISLIYNSFAISLSQRSKQLGMLASVGATKEQKRNSVLFEALLMAIVSIPIGLVSGIVGIGITLKCINPIFQQGLDVTTSLRLIVSVPSIIIAIGVSLLTIFISAYLPAKRASKISPIEAIRQSKDIKIVHKKVKTAKWITRVLGFEGTLGVKNLKRNKKHYRALVFSLFISVVLFISVSSYVLYVSNSFRLASSSGASEIMMSSVPSERMGELYTRISETVKVNKMVYTKKLKINLFLNNLTSSKYLTGDYNKYLKEFYSEFMSEEDFREYWKDASMEFGLYTLDDKSYDEYLDKVGVSKSEREISGILINRAQYKKGYSIKEYDIFEKINTLELMEDYESNKKIELTIDKFTDELPMGFSYSVPNSEIKIILSENSMNNLREQLSEDYGVSGSLYLNADRAETLTPAIKQILDDLNLSGEVDFINVAESVQKNNQIVFAFSVFAYGFIVLISLICMANLCNTISTSFSLRRREFAMLKSVGMTPKAFNKMIRMECVMYGIKALTYGLPVSFLVSLWIYKTVSRNFNSGYIFPLTAFVIAIAMVFVVVSLAMLYSSSKVKKENIIDGLKMDIF